ncbi:hypothetical protein GDO78_015689 [Eleutherodactylus coqui]|uniref:Cystine/glutamate transporter n=1 Tax=Eleutherodactylus coqui TaxID=57060 RepID=A0A8J6EDD0_ELECQ|nr:hypothetical protein GDO78_015689 [Eleutherodactylus coqui]
MGTSQETSGENGAKSEDGAVYLKKKITLVRAISLTIGTIIGSGIFISPKGVLKNSGNIGLSLLIWLASGILSMCGALSYADLGTSIKKSGGHYIYLLETLGPVPAFLRLWAEFVMIRPANIAVVSLAFGRYIIEPLYVPCSAPPIVVKLISAMGIGRTENFQDAFDTSSLALDKIPLAFYSGMFAFGGWMLFVASREGYWPNLFAMIHIKRHTPLPALLLMMPLVFLMIGIGDLYGLLNFYSFSRWLFMGLVAFGLIIHRRKYPDLPRPFKVPLIIPIIFSTMCLFIVGMSLYSDPVNTGIGCLITLSGLPVYYLTIHKQQLPWRMREIFDFLTLKMQVLMEVIPQEIKTY